MKRFLVVALTLTMVLAVSISAMAAQGSWISFASDSTGKLSNTDSQSAYQKVTRTSEQTKVDGLEWTVTCNDAADAAINKSADYSVTEGTGVDASWRINDDNSIRTTENGNTYLKMYTTPDTFDDSRGIVMFKLKLNGNPSSVNTSVGFSTSNGYGLQVAVRNGTLRVKGGEGTSYTIPGWDTDPVLDTQSYHVYALSWVGTTANVWYSNGSDWSGNSSNWTQIVSGYTMTGESTKKTDGGNIKGLAILDGSSGNVWDANIQWMAHSTYDNIDGNMTPWDYNGITSVPSVPEPGSIVAMCSGLIGMVGFARRRRA